MQRSNRGYQKRGLAIEVMFIKLRGVPSMKLHPDLRVTQKQMWLDTPNT